MDDCRVNGGGKPLVDALGLRDLDPVLLALCRDVCLKLSHCSEDGLSVEVEESISAYCRNLKDAPFSVTRAIIWWSGTG